MSARETGLTVAAYSLDGNDYLADLVMASMDGSATTVQSEGIAATDSYTQVAKRAFRHSFEVLLDHDGTSGGRKSTALDTSVWNPGSGSLLGQLRSWDLSLAIPVSDSSGMADEFEWGQVVGARKVVLTTESFVPSGSAVSLMTDFRSSGLSGITKGAVALTFGPLAFSLPMVLTALSHSAERGSQQAYSATFEQQGAPGTAPGGGSLWGVCFSGDALLSLSWDAGAATYTATAVVESLKVSCASGGLVTASGSLVLQGAPTYS
jgi:hypothetical protein